ncbi:MAG: hypothetical protein ACYDHN_09125 [Solirubrobacteraceae bacterium]
MAILASVSAMALTAGVAGAAQQVIYDNIPNPLPGNFASLGNEAYSMSELGGQVEFAETARKNPKVTVVMSAWGCQIGGVFQDTCETPKPGKKFKWPMTLNLYEVGPGNSVGTKIGSVTKTFAMPYRPSENDAACSAKGFEAGTWFDAATNACYHGMAFTITFKVPFEVRGKAIISLAYNTSNHGYSPVGPAACNKTSSGCYYDSLNVATAEPSENTLTVGKQPTEDDYVDSTYGPMFCEGGAEGVFGPAHCPSFWEGIQPMFEVIAK